MSSLPAHEHNSAPIELPALPVDAPSLQPVTSGDRVQSVDVMRGVALLGILAMNIIAFAYPSMAYMNPNLEALRSYTGEFSGANKLAWWVAHTVFDLKMMSIFSMLFGAGLVLMDGRSSQRAAQGGLSQRGFAAIFYRRLAWLLVIGMLHAYLLWWGDILVAYALCGMALYPLRKIRPALLIAIGVCLALFAIPLSAGLGALMDWMRDQATEAQRVADTGGTLTQDQSNILKGYEQMKEGVEPSADVINQTITRMRGSWLDVLSVNAVQAAMLQTFIFALFTLWRALGLMLIGMGLAKLGVFSASRSMRTYGVLAIGGYAIGLPLVHYGGERQIQSNFDMIDFYFVNSHFNYIGSFFVALGHIGLVMVVCRSGTATVVTSRFAAVGQMALTNYLMQSFLCTLYFNGWGFGQYATLERAETYVVVAIVWALELIWSPLWLSRFRFGPAEWVWRSLTYWKTQPMRREPAPLLNT
jgi:uncharacterized protein